MTSADITALVEGLVSRWTGTPAAEQPAPTPSEPAPVVVADSARLRSATTVGRAAVLDAGGRQVHDLVGGRPVRHLALVAAPGHGKSRVLQDLSERAQGLGAEVLRGRAVASARGVPYRPLTEAVSSAARRHRLEPDDSLEPYAAALRVLVPAWGMAGGADATSLSPFVVAEAVRAVMARVARDGAVLVLDDLHWADAETLGVLQALVDGADSRLLLLLGTRPGTPAVDDSLRDWTSLGRVEEWRLGPLSPEDAATLAEAVAGGPLPPVVSQSIAARSEGVPLAVEELVNALVTSGAGRRAARGQVEVVDADAAFDLLPSGLAESISGRLGGLSGTALDLVRAAALLGREFDPDDAARIAGLDGARTASLLAEVGGVGLVERLAAPGRVRYRFDHALTRDAVLAELQGPELKELAARAIDSGVLGTDAAEGERRAELLLVAGRTDQARAVLLEAGRGAARAGALATAERLLRRAQVSGADTPGADAEVAVELVRVLALAGRNDAVGDVAEPALRTSAGAARGRLHLALARVAETGSRTDEASDHVDRAAGLLPPTDPELALVRARVALAERRLAPAEQTLTQALRLDLDVDQACEALELLSRCARTTDEAAAEALLERMAGLADAHGLLGWRLRALSELGTMDVMRLGDGTRLMAARRTAQARGDLTTAALVGFHETIRRFHRLERDGIDDWVAGIEDEVARYGMAPLAHTCAVLRASFAALDGQAGEARSVLDALSAGELDPDRRAVALGIGYAVAALVEDDLEGATAAVTTGVDAVRDRDFGDPSPLWGTWALLSALRDGTSDAAAEVRRRGTTINRINAGLALWVDAIVTGDPEQAGALAAEAISLLAPAPWYAAVALRCAYPIAVARGWSSSLREAARDAARFLQATGSERPGRALARATGDATASAEPSAYGLTPRESEIFALVRTGLSNAEIADRLVISPRTVEKHVERLLDKTGTRTRVQLAVLADGVSPGQPS